MVNLGWCQQCGVQPNGMWGGLVGSVVSCGSTPMGWAAGLWGERSHTAVPQCGVWCCVWWTCGSVVLCSSIPMGLCGGLVGSAADAVMTGKDSTGVRKLMFNWQDGCFSGQTMSHFGLGRLLHPQDVPTPP